MSSSRKASNSSASKKKKTLIIIAVCAGAVAAVIAVLFFCGVFGPAGVRPNFVPDKLTNDFDPENAVPIEKDERYLEYDRDVHYEYAGLGVILTDGYQFSDGDQAKLFKAFFDALKAGDSAALKACFVDGYFDSNESPDGLTPQRVYDIWVNYYSGSEKVKLGDESYDVDNFKVVYKIRLNDYSFRSDTVSDVWKPQIFQIALVGDEYRIVNINRFYS